MRQEDIDAAESNLALGRIIVKGKAPYFVSMLLGMVPVPLEDIETMGVTEGWVLYYNPTWVMQRTPKEMAGLLAHEVNHGIRDHVSRIAKLPNKDAGNMAADMTFNTELIQAGWTLPDGKNKGCFPADFGMPEGLLLEEYYQLFPKSKGGGSSAGKNGTPKDDQGDTPTSGPPGKKQCGNGKCGGIAGNPQKFEKDLDEQFGRSSVEKNAITKQTLHNIKEHIAQKGRGSVPGSLSQLVDLALEEKVTIRWQHELEHLLKKLSGQLEAGGMDFSLLRPSKRSYARGVLRPGLISYQPEVAIIFDTSGSMGDEQVKECVAQAVGIFKSLGIDNAWLIQADSRVAAPPERIHLQDLLENLKIHGRGGTNFDDALRACEKLTPKPDIAIYITDGDGAASYKPYDTEVVWCVVPSPYGRAPSASFGHVIFVRPNGTDDD